jgi:hypothetical protein
MATKPTPTVPRPTTVSAAGNYEQRRYQLDVALAARELEINLFWTRSLVFWGVVVAAAGAVGLALDKSHRLLAFGLTCFGVISSVIWTLVNRGSRFWFVNWENKVVDLEGAVIGPLFDRPDGVERGARSPIWSAGRRFSPSRLIICMSDVVVACWLAALVFQLVYPDGLGVLIQDEMTRGVIR